jgi:3-deoxy-D-manno-octulosonate 8-phosphate phosphatase (KDO 8-P phosphatase)
VDPRLLQIKLFVLDVDGVLTDGGIYVDDLGTESKRFSVYDGSAVWLLRRCGIETAIISGREAKCVAIRARDLEIAECRQGVRDKVVAFEEVRARFAVTPGQCAYMGDDVLDVPLMRAVGFAAAPANARPEAKAAAAYVSTARGGDGAVREVAELILRAQGRYDTLLHEKYGIGPPPAEGRARDAPA